MSIPKWKIGRIKVIIDPKPAGKSKSQQGILLYFNAWKYSSVAWWSFLWAHWGTGPHAAQKGTLSSAIWICGSASTVFFYFILALSLSVQVTSVCPCPSLMPFLGVHAIRQEGPCRLLTGYCFYPWLILRCLIIYMSYSSKDFNKRFSSHTLGLNSRPCCLDKPMIFQIIRCCFPLL